MTIERNKLINGRFLHDLDGWTASGAVYSAGDGDDHYGVAVLEQNEWIEQDFSVSGVRSYTLHLALKSSGEIVASDVTASITDSDGNSLPDIEPTASADTWEETTSEIGLAEGTTYTIRITNNQAEDVKVDDVWIWWVPLTRAEMAARVDRKLARLASDRSLSTGASGSQTEGDYTDAVDAGLRQAGAINPETDEADIRYLDANLTDVVLDSIEREMLERLHRDYAAEVDISVGPRSEKFSQKAAAIEKMIGGASSTPGGKVIQRRISHP